ncbi:HD domain-containing protein [Brevundimonas bacteroides]|uniref:HD domain-containing protein n=1 Tax=Brevundimonas bacteroides TaxID=74311 RepID=UPI000A00BE57|nr:HD domain-containing protein [Brevundimonas bacteroides]
MRQIALTAMLAALAVATPATARQDAQTAPAEATATPAGIPLDSAWRRAVHAHAQQNMAHPSWGWRHSERNYLLALSLAEAEGLSVDADVLFAAAFLHDWGGIAPFAAPGVDHAVRSVELAEPFLRDAGFPMEKFPAVRAAILGHMYDKEPEGPEAIVMHDADALDFLGALGSARLLAATGEGDDYDLALRRIERFAVDIPPRLKTEAAQRMAPDRVAVMTEFLARVRSETPEGARP